MHPFNWYRFSEVHISRIIKTETPTHRGISWCGKNITSHVNGPLQPSPLTVTNSLLQERSFYKYPLDHTVAWLPALGTAPQLPEWSSEWHSSTAIVILLTASLEVIDWRIMSHDQCTYGDMSGRLICCCGPLHWDTLTSQENATIKDGRWAPMGKNESRPGTITVAHLFRCCIFHNESFWAARCCQFKSWDNNSL